MMKTFMTAETLYGSGEPSGVPILDEVAEQLRRSRIIRPAALAKALGVRKGDLYGAIVLLTGLPLGDFICCWRLMQARDVLLGMAPAAARADRVRRLDEAARQCGWRSHRVMLRVARRYGFELES